MSDNNDSNQSSKNDSNPDHTSQEQQEQLVQQGPQEHQIPQQPHHLNNNQTTSQFDEQAPSNQENPQLTESDPYGPYLPNQLQQHELDQYLQDQYLQGQPEVPSQFQFDDNIDPQYHSTLSTQPQSLIQPSQQPHSQYTQEQNIEQHDENVHKDEQPQHQSHPQSSAQQNANPETAQGQSIVDNDQENKIVNVTPSESIPSIVVPESASQVEQSSSTTAPQETLLTHQESHENIIPDGKQSSSSQFDTTQLQEQTTSGDNEIDADVDDPNTSGVLHPFSNPPQQFATPLKSLPPLKDIEPITTPKAFSVAKDTPADSSNSHQNLQVNSSPVTNQNTQRHNNDGVNLGAIEGDENLNMNSEVNDTFMEPAPVRVHAQSHEGLQFIAAFINIDSNSLDPIKDSPEIIESLRRKATQFQDLKSELSFLKLNQERSNQVQEKKFTMLTKKIEKLTETNSQLSTENEKLTASKESDAQLVNSLRNERDSLSTKANSLEHSKTNFDIDYNNAIGSRDQEIRKLNENLHRLTQSNIDKTQQLNQLNKQLSEVNNEKFNYKLELSKVSNESTYIKNQKKWYEEELKSVQSKYSDLIKKQETEYIVNSNKISALTSSKASLQRLNLQKQDENNALQTRLEKLVSKSSQLESKLEVEKIKYVKELQDKDEFIKISKLQSDERLERVNQLEAHLLEVKASLGDSITRLDKELKAKVEKIIALEEKLKRTEDVLDAELHKETELPKLDNSANLIVANNPDGISLSSLYSEFNHLKKQIVLERSQKEKLANQLQLFVAELESKKPAIANYRDQVKFYENSLKEMIGKAETIRIEKAESIKESNRLKLRISEFEGELQSLKQLSKDLGKQLCYYLIHSKVKDDNDDPLSFAERKAIENILAKSGNNDNTETDSDKLISERLLGFSNIVELQQRNQELLTVIRQLTKQLESKEQETKDFEVAAIEEAKEAILTLEGELDSVNLKYEAASKERDLLKNISEGSKLDGSKSEIQLLTESNNDLKYKLKENENLLRDLQSQSSETIKSLTLKLNETKNIKDDLSLQLASLKHAAELAEGRFESSHRSLDNATKEVDHLRNDIKFWKDQVSKQENLLISKTNELRAAEVKNNADQITINNFTTRLEIANSAQKSLKDEIDQLKNDKLQLNQYLNNLQTFIHEKELSNQEIKKRSEDLENLYKSLKQEISDKEDRIKILSSQADLALAAQNTKLEQVNEISQHLLDAKSKLIEKQKLVDTLNGKIYELNKSAHRSHVAPSGTASVNMGATGQLDASDKSILSMDNEHLKVDLQVAQEQVAEFTKIAQGAEASLIDATESFEKFKLESDTKYLALAHEKESLQREVSELNLTIDNVRQELTEAERKHTIEVQELRSHLQTLEIKASSYDDLKKDYDAKFETVNKDLQSQVDINQNIQLKYQETLEENDRLTREIFASKESVEKLNSELAELKKTLESTKSALDSKDDQYASEKESILENLEESKNKIKDLQDQYNIVLNQLELTKSFNEKPTDESVSEDLKEVVTYLRREKESSDAKAAVATEEKGRLEKQLDHILIELEATKSQLLKLQSTSVQLEDASTEHDRILEQLEQLNILRESNTTLRNENERYIEKIASLQQEVINASSRAATGESSTNEADSQTNALKDQQLRLILEENERLKTQLGNNEEATVMMQRFENLKSEFKTKLLNHRNKNKELEKQIEEHKVKAESASKELIDARTKFNQELANVKKQLPAPANNQKQDSALKEQLVKAETTKNENLKKVESLTKEKESLEGQIKILNEKLKSTNTNQNFEEEITKLKSQFNDEKTKLQNSLQAQFESRLKDEVAKVKPSNGTSTNTENEIRSKIEGEWKAKVEALEKSVEQRKLAIENEIKSNFQNEVKAKTAGQNTNESNAKFEEVKKNLINDYEGQIAKLKQDFEDQLSKEKQSIEKKHEFKLRVLTRKIEKLEKSDSSGSQSTPQLANTNVGGQFGSGNASLPGTAGSLPAVPSTSGFIQSQQNSNVGSPAPTTPIVTNNEAQNNNVSQKTPALGHQFTESTLSVHRPNVDRPNTNANTTNNNNNNHNNNNNNQNNNNRKRPFVNKVQTSNKKPSN